MVSPSGSLSLSVTATGTTTGTTSSSKSISKLPPPTTSTAKLPSCVLQNQDPDRGITARGCVCNSGSVTTTLPLLTNTAATNGEQSCSYTALPLSTVPNPISISTQYYTSNCKACTIAGGIANVKCTTLSGCTPVS